MDTLFLIGPRATIYNTKTKKVLLLATDWLLSRIFTFILSMLLIYIIFYISLSHKGLLKQSKNPITD